MLQLLAIIGFMLLAVLVFAGGLHFSQYKKRENAGCCGGGNCGTEKASHSCYSSKAEFVENIDKIKAEKLEARS
jgi:hypothetical protein